MRNALCAVITLVFVWLAAVPTATADEPITLRDNWRGDVTFFATGTNLADDQGGVAGTVDVNIQPQSVTVTTPGDIPTGAALEQAFVYWAGTRYGAACASLDDTITLTVPGGTPASVTADRCHCSVGGSTYDQQVCRYDMTADIQAAGGQLAGTYTVNDFAARIQDGATDDASFSIVLLYRHSSVGVRHVLLYDGIWELSESALTADHQAITFSLSNFEIDTPPKGDLTYYVIEGDIGGSGSESVSVAAQPSGGLLNLSDAVNPVNNPFNRTINTVTPARTGAVGVDIDEFDLTPALAAGDTQVDVTFDAGTDKVWIIYNVVGIDVFEPLFSVRSSKDWILLIDADNNGVPSPGDTLRYTLHLENTGNTTGTLTISDPMPAAIQSWVLVSNGGGANLSTARTLVISNLSIDIQTSTDIVFDAVLADTADQTVMTNTAVYSDPPEGGTGGDLTVQTEIRKDSDGDSVFDNDDNCPNLTNANQADVDRDGVGDLCDPCPIDAPDDTDLDGTCDSDDLCPNSNDTFDADNDGVPDGCDVCAGDDGLDADLDTVPDACDVCAAGDDHLDTDSDGIPNACDTCGVADSGSDADNDGAPDACDICPGFDDKLDADNDTVPDGCDRCPRGDDRSDQDSDLVPDACDLCPGGDDSHDADQDRVPNDCDLCSTGDDSVDGDTDGIADACDLCLAGDDSQDADGDSIPDACDPESCDDGVDNDGDGKSDCYDVDCGGQVSCLASVETMEDTPPQHANYGNSQSCDCRLGTQTKSVFLPALFLGLLLLLGRRRRQH
ncbi:MAG: hypothetical protein CO108_18710 [Deltaproteobacteria bacterium CG_4_9_14_3_um_filter_63_12]|nr:MAG: hypothetical protein CO108_18710 [Deltaproteobacteria bacterium CG_4_9_14_3_um_filter_63_12]